MHGVCHLDLLLLLIELGNIFCVAPGNSRNCLADKNALAKTQTKGKKRVWEIGFAISKLEK